MSKIDDLIAQYCPDGVEWKELGEVLSRSKGTKITAAQMKELHSTIGDIKVFAGGKTFAMIMSDCIPSKDINYKPSIIVKSRGVIEFEYYDKPFSHKNEFWSYYSEGENILIKYIYYYLKLNEGYFQQLASKMQMPQISLPDTQKYKVPIPAIEVQEEIVSILDKFTALEVELEAELEARTRQYEYYRNELLSFEGKDVEWKSLGEVGEFIRGSGLQKTDFRESGVGCIHYGQIYTYYGSSATETKSFVSEDLAAKLRKAKKGDLVIAGVSENIEDVCKAVVWLGEDDICISGDSWAYRHNQNPKFIGYLFQTNRFLEFKKKYAQGAKVTRLRSGSLPTFTIPVPPIAEQERIVAILDQFDTLVNDIFTGLPAEIQARRQQYEYYRGKLLTFEPIVIG